MVALHGTAADAQRAIPAWLPGPGAIDARLETLLAADPSAVQLPRVPGRVATRRQDLIDAYVPSAMHSGRFAPPPDAGGVPIVTSSVLGWSPRLLARYAARLRAGATDPGCDGTFA